MSRCCHSSRIGVHKQVLFGLSAGSALPQYCISSGSWARNKWRPPLKLSKGEEFIISGINQMLSMLLLLSSSAQSFVILLLQSFAVVAAIVIIFVCHCPCHCCYHYHSYCCRCRCAGCCCHGCHCHQCCCCCHHPTHHQPWAGRKGGSQTCQIFRGRASPRWFKT